MKKQILGFLTLVFIAGIADNFAPEDATAPVYVEYFTDGQILPPDYVCPDTLIVFDAHGLNKAMALVEQGFFDATDYELDSIMHTHCKIK